MSNSAVGALYQRIIDSVLESSRTDFEESGVEGRTIDDMRQSHMSNMQRAHFPWEPTPTAESAALPASNPSAASTARHTATATPTVSNSLPPAAPVAAPPPQPQTVIQPVAPQPSTPSAPSATKQDLNSNSTGGVKQEQPFDTSFLNLPNTTPAGAYNQNPHYAQQRAINNIQQKFGNQASGVFTNGSNSQQPPSPSSDQPPAKRIKTETSIPQTDGSCDHISSDQAIESQDARQRWQAIKASQASVSAEQRAHADSLMRTEALRIQHRLEGGGLLVPLDSSSPPLHVISSSLSRPLRSPDHPPSRTDSSRGQVDGGDDDSDSDRYPDEEDAINSDLDDPDEENVESALAGEVSEGDVILCLYDKVQRVKNKWKCQLKDGVCTIDGRDYVFHKANGEFEW